jgi:hypothetical protein
MNKGNNIPLCETKNGRGKPGNKTIWTEEVGFNYET